MLIKEICLFNPTSPTKYTEFINYIDTSSVIDGTLTNIQQLTENFPSRAKRVLQRNDILISSVRPNLKHNFFVNCDFENLVGSTGFIQLRVSSKLVDPKYLYYFLTNDKTIKHYSSIAEGAQTTFPSFNKDVIENIQFPDITYEAQHHIVNTISFLLLKSL